MTRNRGSTTSKATDANIPSQTVKTRTSSANLTTQRKGADDRPHTSAVFLTSDQEYERGAFRRHTGEGACGDVDGQTRHHADRGPYSDGRGGYAADLNGHNGQIVKGSDDGFRGKPVSILSKSAGKSREECDEYERPTEFAHARRSKGAYVESVQAGHKVASAKGSVALNGGRHEGSVAAPRKVAEKSKERMYEVCVSWSVRA